VTVTCYFKHRKDGFVSDLLLLIQISSLSVVTINLLGSEDEEFFLNLVVLIILLVVFYA